MKDSRERFTEAAAAYSRHRPSYPATLVDWVVAEAGLAPGARIVDLGCGTGISSRLFAARGFRVTGIDPNEEMLRHARASTDGGGTPIAYRHGEAVATGLDRPSVELAIAAQAFHWFPIEATLAEIDRVVVPGGAAAAFWNMRASTPLLDAYERLLREHSSEYAAIATAEGLPALRAALASRGSREASFEHHQRLDHAAFRGRVYSASYVVHGIPRREEFDRELDELFRRHQEDGEVVFALRTEAILWRAGSRG